MKKKIIFTILLISAYSIQAQIMPLNNEHLLNEFIINPALAGINDNTSISILSRMQWLGLSDAPRSQCVSFDSRIKAKGRYNHTGKLIRKSRIPRTGRVGFGGFVFNDRNKPFSRTVINLAYSYHLKTGKKRQHNLSLGFGVSVFLFGIDNSQFFASDMSDPTLSANENVFVPNLSFGLKYKYKNLFIAASSVHFMPMEIQFSDLRNEVEKNKNQLFIHSGINLSETKKISITPSIIYRSITNQIDANIFVASSKKYSLLISYHSTQSASATLGLKIKKLSIYYSYQFSTGEISNYNNGSQMMMIKYEI